MPVHTKRAENLLAARQPATVGAQQSAAERSRVIEEPSAGSSRRPYTRFARGVPVRAYSWASSIGVLRFQKLTSSVHQERAPQRLCCPFGRRGSREDGHGRRSQAAARGVSKGLTKGGCR